METETLSSYVHSQEKHILNDGMSVNIPDQDDDSNTLLPNEINEADSDVFAESGRYEFSKKQDNVKNCDDIVSSSEPKISIQDNLGQHNFDRDAKDPLGDESVNSPNVSSTIQEEEEEESILSGQEDRSVLNESYDSLSKGERESYSPSEKTDPLSDEVQNLSDTSCKKRDSHDEEYHSEKEDNSFESNKTDEEKNKIKSVTNEKDNVEDCATKVITEENKQDADNEEGDTEENEQKGEQSIEENEKSYDESKELEQNNDNNIKECPLLKETLTKPRKYDNVGDKETENENEADEMDEDDDFDPSLLCPDIAMEVDEAPVITTTDNVPSDGSKSPLLYEAVYSTYVDEMTGAEVSFNLSPDEHRMRQDTYGEKNPVQFTKIHCTACNVHLGSALDGQTNRFVHPLLKVLICKDCYHFYTSGEFEKDEDGSELYCRWCGQGGQVICCSACEMVFCKKCIRINFGRRKLTEIRDSDDWACFRCNPAQLTFLRVHCAEFMEYVRREISRAATLENATSFMTTDYTQCCLAQKKKYTDPTSNEPKKKRKKHHDPDYEPKLHAPDSPKLNLPVEAKIMSPKPVPILPKPTDASRPQVTQAGTSSGVFKVGNTTFRPRAAYSQIRPVMPVTPTGVRPQGAGPGYIKIMPSGIRAASSIRQSNQTFASSPVRPQPSFRQVRPGSNSNSAPMKHEWFEKTVRAAARVNSNLSYTLTQLNRAQASATSVEALAVVHNKLQEILSTSINSLIQIRKNLRTEFIAGIKNIRFPPKPPQSRPLPSTSAQDDDVIFVSPTTSPVPPPLTVTNPTILTPSVTLTNSSVTPKRNFVPIVPTTTLQPIPGTSTSTSTSGEKPKMFIRVKSLSALQNVTSECITIPDDPIPPLELPSLTPIKPLGDAIIVEGSSEKKEDLTLTEGGSTLKEDDSDVKDSSAFKEAGSTLQKDSFILKEDSSSVKEDDCTHKDVPPLNGDDKNNAVNEIEKKISETEVATDDDERCDKNLHDENSNESKYKNDFIRTVNLEDSSSLDLKKMLNAKVYIMRSEKIDELVRNKFGLVNGNTSE